MRAPSKQIVENSVVRSSSRMRTICKMLRKAFFASLIGSLLGGELVGLWLALSILLSSAPDVPLALAIILTAPAIAACFAVPLGTLAAVLISPIAKKVARFRTARALAQLSSLGALWGLAFLFAIEIATAGLFRVPGFDEPELLICWCGPLFGVSVAVGWWWQLPRTRATPPAAL